MLGAVAASFGGGYALTQGTGSTSAPEARAARGLVVREAVRRPHAPSDGLRDEIARLLDARYVEPVAPAVLAERSVSGMLAQLDDPYTSYLSPAELAAENRELSGRYSGVGVSIAGGPRGFVVRDLEPGSPAELAGIKRGDVIVGIDDVAAADLGVAEAAQRLSGQTGSDVIVHIRSRGDGTERPVRVVRTTVTPSIAFRTLRRGTRSILVVKVQHFSSGIASAVRDGVARAVRTGVSGIVLDLRGNPGGLVDEAVGVCSVFMDGGTVAVTVGEHVRPHRLEAARGGFVTLPLAVAVDRDTASSAELVAAALGDRHRALVVGTATFGKTSMQEIVPLASGGALRLTVAHFRSAEGDDLSGHGLRPQVLTAPERAVARAATLLGPAGR